jgi:flagellar motor switch protein FliN/FliY
MNNSALTQQEIDALLGKSDFTSFAKENNRLGKMLPRFTKSIALVLSSLFDRPVIIKLIARSARLKDSILDIRYDPFIVTEVDYVSRENGIVMFSIDKKSSDIFNDLMISERMPDKGIDRKDAYLDAVTNVFDQVALGIGRELGKVEAVTNKPLYPRSEFSDGLKDFWRHKFTLDKDEFGVILECSVGIEGFENISFLIFFPDWFASRFESGQSPSSGGQSNNERLIPIRPVKFSEFDDKKKGSIFPDFELIADVPLQISAELGRTTMHLRDVLALHKGSVIELNRLAGEPADVFINDKVFATGEVLVVGESFGIKIINIMRGEQTGKDD